MRFLPAALPAAASAAILTMIAAGPARADAIDGDWCSPEGGKSLTIAGPNIRTPGGKQITGRYGRHDFHYVAPEGDPRPGVAIDMRLMGENAVRVTPEGGQPVVWRRCPQATS